MITTLLFVYLIKGLKLLAYVLLIVIHGSSPVMSAHGHHLVRLSYVALLVVALLELWR